MKQFLLLFIRPIVQNSDRLFDVKHIQQEKIFLDLFPSHKQNHDNMKQEKKTESAADSPKSILYTESPVVQD